MEWFNGGVLNAISLCRQNQSLFVVYVHDESGASVATNQAWEDSQVVALLSARKYVALKLLKESLQCRQFSQLFPVFVYPSVFCIGSSGQVLVSMSGGQSAEQLVTKLTEAFTKLEADLSPTTPLQQVSTPPLVVTTPTGAADEPDAGQQPSLDEKVQRAKELIKQRRAEKEEKQSERGKSDEIQRREAGREMTKVKEKHEERATQDWIQERRRQKEEDKKAREDVRAKLNQDRRERESRAVAAQRERSAPTVPTVMSSISASSGTCRIQLKLPEGGSTVVELERTARLAQLRQSAAKEVGVAVESVTLTSMYPRQELSREIDDQTMTQLQLVPSAVVLVRAKKGFVSSLKSDGGGGGVGGAITYVFQLLLWFVTFIKNAIAGLFGGGAPREAATEDSQLPDVRRERLAALDGSGRGSGRDQETGPRLRRFRQEDYQDESDDEDNKQTYNGNSTQQQ